MSRQEQVLYLIAHPDELLKKKPFFRGSETWKVNDADDHVDEEVTKLRTASLPDVRKNIVTQDRFLKELDPMCHEVMYDKNLPSICVKLDDGGYYEIEWKQLPLAIQKRIMEKKALVMCGYPVQFLNPNPEPTEEESKFFQLYKDRWTERNQDGMRTKAVATQLSMGDVAQLFYIDYKGRIKSRIYSYEDGYQIISHSDENGDRLLECLYYKDFDGVTHIDCYADEHIYCLTDVAPVGYDVDEDGWYRAEPKRHGFSEIPIATKRGAVAWNDVQALIEVFEIIYNIFMVIQKRHGWGILYIRGQFSENARKIAGSVILNDKSVEGNGTAEFKAPPSPDGMLESLKSIFQQIQIGSSCTFLLPEDIKASGDISGLAVMLTQSLDIEGGNLNIIEWQNYADKCARLFKEGLAMELKKNPEEGFENPEENLEKLRVTASYKLWRPFSEAEFNQMLATLKNAGLLSSKTGIERNTVSAPDEVLRVQREIEEQERKEEEKAKKEFARQQAQAASTSSNTNE